jgi:uncharacterized RDD family membrane protein YckC
MNNNEYEYAGFWVRAGAIILDSILLGIVTIPLLFAIYGQEEILNSDKSILGIADLLISYVLPIIYSVLMWNYKSATFGKMILKLKVVDEVTGLKPTFFQSLGRYIGYLISTITLFIGFIWIAFDSRKQGFHDKISKTVVVRNKQVVDEVNFNN